jgi:4-hydroxy-2-oxoheptanedioate aldolase
MGFLGQPGHPAVHQTILDGIATVRAAGKAAGILSVDPVRARQYLDAGALFVAVGVDTSLLINAAKKLAATFMGAPTAAANSGSGY